MTTYHLWISTHGDFCSGVQPLNWGLQLDNEQDFAQAKRLCGNQKNMVGFWKQTVFPIRDQLSDFFSPTLINIVMKTKELAENFWAVIGAIIWDLATFPIRLVTFLPYRSYTVFLTTPTEHPLIPYLKGKGLYSNSIALDGRVTITLYTEKVKEDHQAERRCEQYSLYLTDREITFPMYKKHVYSHTRTLESWERPPCKPVG